MSARTDAWVSKKQKPRPIAIPRHLWAGTPMLDPAAQLNAHCFAQLTEAAKSAPPSTGSAAIEALRERASEIVPAVSARAGRCPVLLINVHFENLEWWRGVASGLPRAMAVSTAPPLFGREVGAVLLHEILTHAWLTAQSQMRATSVLFGMAPQVAETVAHLTVVDIERIANGLSSHLRPRWEESRTFWRRLIRAAIAADASALVDVQLHCLSLLGGDLVTVRSAG